MLNIIKKTLVLDLFNPRMKTPQLLTQILLMPLHQRLMLLKLKKKLKQQPLLLPKKRLLPLMPLLKKLLSQHQLNPKKKKLSPHNQKLCKNIKIWKRKYKPKLKLWSQNQQIFQRKNKQKKRRRMLKTWLIKPMLKDTWNKLLWRVMKSLIFKKQMQPERELLLIQMIQDLDRRLLKQKCKRKKMIKCYLNSRKKLLQ